MLEFPSPTGAKGSGSDVMAGNIKTRMEYCRDNEVDCMYEVDLGPVVEAGEKAQDATLKYRDVDGL